MIPSDLVDLSRLQFALTAMYHFIFVPLTLGMSLFVAPRWQNLRAMLHGMADALRGRGGPYRR